MAEYMGRENGVSSPRFSEYGTFPHRPPELWDASEKEVQAHLAPAVDLWACGCVMYERTAAKVLMRPLDHAALTPSTCRQALRQWCQAWPEISSSCITDRHGSKAARLWQARLWRAGEWRAAILAACDPNPKKRKW